MAAHLLCSSVNETPARMPQKLLCACAQEALQSRKQTGNFSLTFVYVSPQRMRILNRAHRGMDAATDVLSFEGGELDAPMHSSQEDKTDYLGEVILCPEFIREHLPKGKNYTWELCHVAVHGTLHLLGMDHERSEKEHAKMHKLEEKIIEKVLKSR